MSLEQADALRRLRRWAEAIEAYDAYLTAHPDDTRAYLGRGTAALAKGDAMAATSDLTRVVEKDPADEQARYLRSIAYAQGGRDSEAESDLDVLIDAGPSAWYLWSDRGGIRLRTGRTLEAIDDLREAIRLRPDEPAVHLNLGLALSEAGRLAEAHTHLARTARQALRGAAGARDHVRMRLWLAAADRGEIQDSVYRLLGAGSASEVARLTEERPYILLTGFTAMVAALVREHPDVVAPTAVARVDDLRRLVEDETGALASPLPRPARPPSDPTGIAELERLATRVSALQERGDYKEAVKVAADAAACAARVFGATSGEYGVHLANHAALLTKTGASDRGGQTFDEAIAVLEQARYPQLAGVLASRAVLYEQAADSSAALETYHRALALVRADGSLANHADAARVYRGLAELLLASEPATLEELCREALVDDLFRGEHATDSRAMILTTLSEALLTQGRVDEAVAPCKQALQLRRARHGEDHQLAAEAMRNLGRLYWRAGRVDSATHWLRQSAQVWRRLSDSEMQRALTEADLAEVYAQAGAADQARRQASEALAAAVPGSHDHSRQLPHVLEGVRAAYLSLGDLDASLRIGGQIVEAVHARDGRSVALATATNNHADTHYRLDRLEEAERLYSDALDIIQGQAPTDPVVLFSLRHNLANVRYRTDRLDDAFALHETAFDGLRGQCGADDSLLLGALVHVAGLYADAGRQVRAAELLAEAVPHLAGRPEFESRAAELSRRLQVDDVRPDGHDSVRSTLTSGDVLYAQLLAEATTAGSEQRHADAERLLIEALDLALDTVGPAHRDIATLNLQLARVRLAAGSSLGVAERLRQALAIRQQALPPDDPSIDTVRGEFADVLRSAGRDAEAAELYRTLLDRGVGLPTQTRGSVLTGLGWIAQHRGDLVGAERLLREALRLADGDDSPSAGDNRIVARRNLAKFLIYAVRIPEAEEAATAALALAVDRYDPAAPELAHALLTASEAIRIAGRNTDAEPFARRALSILERVHHPDHPATVAAMNELGAALHSQGQFDEGERWLRRAATAAATDDNTARSMTALVNHAVARADLGDLEGAHKMLSTAVETLRQTGGADDPQYGQVLGVLGRVELASGRHPAAVEHLHQACDVIEATLGPNHPSRLESLSDLAEVYLTIGARDTGRSFAEASVRTAREVYGVGHPLLARFLARLARHRAFGGDPASAEQLYQEALELQPSNREVLRHLADLQAARGRRAAAMSTFERVVEAEDERLSEVLAASSERHRTNFLTALQTTLDAYLTLAFTGESHDQTLIRRAWHLALRRRGLNAEYLRFERAIASGERRPHLGRVFISRAGCWPA